MANEKKELLKKAMEIAELIPLVNDDVLSSHIQRDDFVKAAWLAIISGRPAFFLGTPGVDKTGSIKAMAKRIDGAVFYEQLMPLVSSGADLIVESTSIRENPEADGGKSIATVDKIGRAAGAHLFFGDEIWKTPDTALKTLFDLFNMDDIRHEGQVVKNSLLTFLTASNELPETGSQLEALWSRITIRVVINPLDKAGKTQLVKSRLARYQSKAIGAKTSTEAKLALEDVKLLQKARPFVEISNEIVGIVLEIYQELIDENNSDFDWLWQDDRRFGRVFDVMQANTLLSGRTRVTKEDLKVLEWLLWDTPDQIAIVKAKIAPYCKTALDDAQEIINTLLIPGGTVETVRGGDNIKGVQAINQCNQALKDLESLKNSAGDSVMASAIANLISQVNSARQDVIAIVTGMKI